ncbi:shikimate dehydrogenase [Motilimonas sp. KMU-193]|uniref:shikimate dehydrogenase n=1 Tax=Motilimonas sp. KMU-193 TaxID=3388668 RepID=UPI00396B17DD
MDKYAVFGHPISHSKSPFIHTLFARQTHEDISYQAIEAPVDDFAGELTRFFASGGKGCNVTLPFKEQAYSAADRLTPRAQLAGAVNTLKLTDDGQIIGDNTDGAGLVQDLKNHHVELKGARILLLGAGGAARGVCGPLLDEQPQSLVIANRTHAKAQLLADLFNQHGAITALAFSDLTGEFDLIINSTSASLSGELPPISQTLIRPETAVYDMMYGSGDTVFMSWAKQAGARIVLDGLGMLVGQAAESFAVWRGIKPGSKQVMSELRRNLAV